MNYRLIASLVASIISSTSYADGIEDFILAYSSSQASNLPIKFKNQTLSLTSLDLIAVTTLKKMGSKEILQKYYEQPEFQKMLRLVIQNQINSSAVDFIFDDASIKLFNNLYTMEEMQALYQLNSSESGKEFIDTMEAVEQTTQNFIELGYKIQFDIESYKKLELDIKNVFKNIKTDEIAENREETKKETENIIESLQQTTIPTTLTEQQNSLVAEKMSIDP